MTTPVARATFSRAGWLVCPRLTGEWTRSHERDLWPGDRAETLVPCGYEGGRRELLCHLVATHRVPLASAREVVEELARVRA